jgi:hypothetical protein
MKALAMDWHTRLNHIRFSRAVLFMEKWTSLIFIAIMILAGFALPFVGAIGAVLAILFVLVYSGHYNLEEAAGMPVNRLSMRY